ncbi:MAG: hypothetical protein AAGA68_21570 [Pseudomonadota bacterium]
MSEPVKGDTTPDQPFSLLASGVVARLAGAAFLAILLWVATAWAMGLLP